MRFECGPSHDRRTLSIDLLNDIDQMGVFVSGGIDSAILYYLLCLMNKENGFSHKIYPIITLREDGSRYFSRMVIDYVHRVLGLPRLEPGIVGDPYLTPDQQVRSGVIQAIGEYKIRPVYLGVIEEIPEHFIGWEIPKIQENEFLKAPFLSIRKSHIIDIVFQCRQEFLFHITHTCDTYQIGRCGNCNGCRSRQWGFDQLGKTDPGNI